MKSFKELVSAVEEAKAHTVPKTDKEKDLAKLAPPHDKVTHADVMVGRGVKKEEEMDEMSSKEKMKRGLYNKEAVEELDEASIKLFMGFYQVWHKGKKVGSYASKTDAQDHARSLKEEVEELDEISKSTLGSYVDKAKQSVVDTKRAAGQAAHQAFKNEKRSPSAQIKHLKARDALNAAAKKREAGIAKANTRLAKASVDEGTIAKPQKDLKKHSATANRMAIQKKADKDHESWLDNLEKTDPDHPSLKYRKQATNEDLDFTEDYNPMADYMSQIAKDVGDLQEKKLTPAELKKREDIAQAMERENPGMDMGKKMAIATAQAKKVAEEVEELDELQQSTLQSYAQKALDDKNYNKRKNRPADIVRALRKVHAKQTGMGEEMDTDEPELEESRGHKILASKMSSMASWNKQPETKKDDPPFEPDAPKKNPSATAGKFGQGYSTARHLARQGMKAVTKEEAESGNIWSKSGKTATHNKTGEKTHEYLEYDKEGKSTGRQQYRNAAGKVMESVELDEAMMTQSQLMKKIKDGTHEAMTDIKPGKHVEVRHTGTGKRSMVMVKPESVKEEVEELDEDMPVSVTVHYKHKDGKTNSATHFTAKNAAEHEADVKKAGGTITGRTLNYSSGKKEKRTMGEEMDAASQEKAKKDFDLAMKKAQNSQRAAKALSKEEVELGEAMLSYTEFRDKIDAHKKAGHKVVDDKYSKDKAHFTSIDKEGYGRKVTHTPTGTKMENLGKVSKVNDDEDDEVNQTDKRGRGRPAGSKSGARRH